MFLIYQLESVEIRTKLTDTYSYFVKVIASWHFPLVSWGYEMSLTEEVNQTFKLILLLIWFSTQLMMMIVLNR